MRRFSTSSPPCSAFLTPSRQARPSSRSTQARIAVAAEARLAQPLSCWWVSPLSGGSVARRGSRRSIDARFLRGRWLCLRLALRSLGWAVAPLPRADGRRFGHRGGIGSGSVLEGVPREGSISPGGQVFDLALSDRNEPRAQRTTKAKPIASAFKHERRTLERGASVEVGIGHPGRG